MPRILVVDDEESIRSMLQLVLQKEGFTVTTVGTVMDALALISHLHFDVLISDLNIGHPADGFVVVSAMRRTQPDASTFILTGYPDFETALEALRQDVGDYLIKGTPARKAQKPASRSIN
jgi:DNA-binding NtrC family response regulator